jgi:hypothetical protein
MWLDYLSSRGCETPTISSSTHLVHQPLAAVEEHSSRRDDVHVRRSPYCLLEKVTDGTQNRRPRVLILGGGFGGIRAARSLRAADVDVVLVDKHDYHAFQPLLYQVASDLLEASTVGHPLRDLFHEQPNAPVHQDTVMAIDPGRREVQSAEMAPLTYDYLVLGLRARRRTSRGGRFTSRSFPPAKTGQRR